MSGFGDAFEEAFNLLCGDKIGYGMSRTVFNCLLVPDCVVKVETDSRRFQNAIEYEIWQRVAGTSAARWFAAVRWISPNGKILIMERTAQPAPGDYPSQVPVYLSDLKRSNYGMASSIDKKTGKLSKKRWLVCHDYGTSMVFERGYETKAKKKADWWDE